MFVMINFTGKGLGGYLNLLINMAINVCGWAWLGMIVVGNLWHEFGIANPIGFLWILPFACLWTLIANLFTTGNSRVINFNL